MTPLQTLELKLGLLEGIRFSQSVGSLFHGVLMENIDSSYCEFLHQQALRPYSQYVYFDRARQNLYWRISSLNSTAAQEILQAAEALPQFIHLKQKNLDVCILSRKFISSSDYSGLAEKYFAEPLNVLDVEYNFYTSCSFKTEGTYALYPQPQLLLGSLLRKWNAFADREVLTERGLAADLAGQVYVYGYNLKLQPFALEKVSLPAFRGTYTLALKSNIMANKIICMLSDFAAYSGIGIKTALGMGACKAKFIARSKEK